ncbi:uncharacterized protein LOC111494871 [Cucurbita maxima]|uniref:Uncharacterized protein LOC111494871 n=1 Tax=Cucurbita maxima TaxID=3661 RepID=A0A6J1KN57_CUCMA|nr:uncharacterized protein LOC111494871 [Cucurbita maxima]
MMFKLDRFAPLLKATSTLALIGEKADLRITPIMLSLEVKHPSPAFNAGLLLSPGFFTFYYTNKSHHYSIISLELFYITMNIMNARGFSSMLFFLIERSNRLYLRFDHSKIEPKVTSFRELTLNPPEMNHLARLDYGTFVSIDSPTFRSIVTELRADYAHVTLTDSQVKFSNADKEIVLTKRKKQCIIGDVTEKDEIKFVIALQPTMFFHDLSHQSARVWLFKSSNSSSAMIVPVGMYTQFWVYFPPKE